MKRPITRDKHFYILLVLFIACTVFYYFGELVNFFGWAALRWDIFYTIHDLQRMLFLVPILYSTYYYRVRGALLANVISLLIFLPRVLFIAPSLETAVRTAFFVMMAAIFSAFTALILNQRDKLHRSVDALKQLEEKNRSILEQIYDSCYEVDLAGNFTYVNQSMCRNLGYSREELIGNNYRLTVPEDDIKPLLLAANEVFRTGEPNKGFEHKILRKDGIILFAETSISLRKNEKGEIVGFRSISRDITERKQAEKALRESESQYRLLSEHMTDFVWLMNMNLEPIYQSPSVEKLTGFTQEEIMELPMEKRVTPESLKLASEYFLNELPRVEAEPDYNPIYTIELEIYRKDGTTLWSENKFSIIRDENGKPLSILGEARDITERKQAEKALRSAEEKYRSLVENINDVFYMLDTEGNITYVSPVVERLTKYKVSDLIGKPFIPLIYPDDLPGLLNSFNRLVSGHLEPWEFRVLDKDGRVIFVRTSSRPLYKDGEIAGVTALMTDISERKLLEQKLEELATHDYLTCLPNRVLLTDRFTIAAALSHRNKSRLAVMSLDLDNFKSINDTLGHEAGDQVLKTVSTRLAALIRASDTLARIGGDEFVLVMLETKRMEDATAVAQKILDSFAEPLLIDGHPLHLSTSIGIAIYPEDAEDIETLIKKSDAAMYYSKGHGRNQFKFFSDGDVRMGGDHKSAPDQG